MVKELITENFDSSITKNTRPVIIKASAAWCGPCIQMAPVFKQIAHELADQIDFFDLNVDGARDVAIKFGITSIPTILFIKDGQIMHKAVGYIDADDLRTKITQFVGALS